MIKRISGNITYCSEAILVDTQVLLWTFYGKSGFSPNQYQSDYSTFLANTFIKNKYIYTTALNVSEVFNLIEHAEFMIYCSKNSIKLSSNNRTAELKKYRSIPAEQIALRNEIKNVYNQIISQMHILSSNVSHKDILEYSRIMPNCPDFFDLSLVQASNEYQIHNILTDDSDFKYFSTDPTLNIYTNNNKI